MVDGRRDRRGRRRDRHPPAARRTTSSSRTSACSWSTRSSASACSHKEAIKQLQGRRRRAHAHRHADPAHARDEPHRHPRPHAAQHAAGRAPADPHLRRRVRRPGRRPRRSAASCCARARCSSCTTGCRTSSRSPAELRELVPEARIAVAHGQMDEGTLEQVVLDFWEGEFDVLVCTTIIESGIDMPTVNTLVVDRADLLGPRAAPPAARPGRPGRAAGLRLPVLPARPGAHRGGLRAAQDHRRGHRARLGLQDRHARPRDPRRRQPARHRAVGPHRRGRLRPLLPDGHRGGGRAEGRDADASRPRSRSSCPSTPTSPRTTSSGRSCGSRPTGAWPRSRPQAEVDDIRAEWVDRYGPVPAGRRGAARGRPAAGRVRPHRRPRGHRHQGQRRSAVRKYLARITPLALPDVARRSGSSASTRAPSTSPTRASCSCR